MVYRVHQINLIINTHNIRQAHQNKSINETQDLSSSSKNHQCNVGVFAERPNSEIHRREICIEESLHFNNINTSVQIKGIYTAEVERREPAEKRKTKQRNRVRKGPPGSWSPGGAPRASPGGR
jgi:hypothetical protein